MGKKTKRLFSLGGKAQKGRRNYAAAPETKFVRVLREFLKPKPRPKEGRKP